MDFTDEATIMGLAGALSEEISADGNEYNLDESTDEENWNKTMLYNRDNATIYELPPFEQYIRDICDGKISLLKKNRK